MSGLLPRERLKQMVAARLAPAGPAATAALDRRFAAALKAARLADKPSYRPEEVARLGEALMAAAYEDVAAGLAALETLEAEVDREDAP